MNQSNSGHVLPLPGIFHNAAALAPAAPRPDASRPFSLRLTAAERARLEAQAGSQPLGAYLRSRLLGDDVRPRRASRRPALDHQKLALVLAELGRSRLSSNINQLARAANTGTLDLSPALSQDLTEACRAIHAMRDLLIAALGLKPDSGEPA